MHLPKPRLRGVRSTWWTLPVRPRVSGYLKKEFSEDTKCLGSVLVERGRCSSLLPEGRHALLLSFACRSRHSDTNIWISEITCILLYNYCRETLVAASDAKGKTRFRSLSYSCFRGSSLPLTLYYRSATTVSYIVTCIHIGVIDQPTRIFDSKDPSRLYKAC